jgi:hypothetical protein
MPFDRGYKLKNLSEFISTTQPKTDMKDRHYSIVEAAIELMAFYVRWSIHFCDP